ncbi:hypothetical protein J6590_092955 [Homalodisca vitripennis]|nr:hypothetical protein J6590_092955 [Homalodisca vitripennis]
MLLHRTPVCIKVSVDPHQNTALENGGESLTHLAGVLRSTSTRRVMTGEGVVEGTNTSTAV